MREGATHLTTCNLPVPANTTRVNQLSHIQLPSSQRARDAIQLANTLQTRLAERLIATAFDALRCEALFSPKHWGRDDGRHGGGVRLQHRDSDAFDRASCNVSAVHYDDMPEKRLASANALSCIIHPRPAAAPSLHMHISFTETRDGRGYWRIMADLNPSHPNDEDTASFSAAVRAAFSRHHEGDSLFKYAREQGDKYFYIPALQRHRGAFHIYLEQYTSGDFLEDCHFARTVGTAVIDAYTQILGSRLPVTDSAMTQSGQLAYHTLYFFQVLTLDRGTTSGLLVHDQNDIGILGSLPSHVDTELLETWLPKVPELQVPLLSSLIAAFPQRGRVRVTEQMKRELAKTVRSYYRDHPEGLSLQARGDVVPPTVQNHR